MLIRELILVPIFLSLIIGLGTQLADLASETSQKTLSFSDEANSAVDCAFRGIDVNLCAPNITDSANFTPQIKKLNKIADEAVAKSNVILMQYGNRTVAFEVKTVDGKMMLVEASDDVDSDSSTSLTGQFIGQSDRFLSLEKNRFSNIDIDNDAIYDAQFSYADEGLIIRRINRPTLQYFLQSILVWIGLIGLILYGLLWIKKN